MHQKLEAVAAVVEEFIRRRFDVAEGDTLFSRAVDLWENGYVDSLGVAELVVFLESYFGVQLPPSALFSPSFSHIKGISEIVAGLLARSTGDAE